MVESAPADTDPGRMNWQESAYLFMFPKQQVSFSFTSFHTCVHSDRWMARLKLIEHSNLCWNRLKTLQNGKVIIVFVWPSLNSTLTAWYCFVNQEFGEQRVNRKYKISRIWILNAKKPWYFLRRKWTICEWLSCLWMCEPGKIPAR